ncbi:response regulator transcription factor [Owariibacterium komagatae]|uniref:response regulator transcription factor n=1 Tax=Owariibacterium komagatae TaxID=3136601 RepID=UPI0038B230E9
MRILMIEDDRELCRAVGASLSAEGVEADFCHDGDEAYEYLLQDIYDVCCLDRMLPHTDGLTLLRKARAAGVQTPVLMLTALSRIGDRVDGLDAGADDYLAKPFDMRELLARLRALARRPAPFSSHTTVRTGTLTLDLTQLTLQGPTGIVGLSRKECDLLETLMRHPGQLMGRSVLLGRVWGMDAPVEEGSLDSYIHFVRRRLKTVGAKETVSTVRGAGYRLEASSC